jgi:hypothetical protein
MDMKKILIIFLLIVIYSIVFWPTLTIYTHTAQNILVKINRITGESYYCAYDEWRKINTEIEIKTYSSGFEPITEPMKENKDYGGGVRKLSEDK